MLITQRSSLAQNFRNVKHILLIKNYFCLFKKKKNLRWHILS